MRYSIAAFSLVGAVAACSAQEGMTMSEKNLVLTVECGGPGDCFNISEGQGQVPMAIKIENISNEIVDFPVNAFDELFLYAKYENPANGLEYTVPAPPQELSKDYAGTEIPPGNSVLINDVLYPEYIEMVADKKDHTAQKIIAKYTVPNIKGWEQFSGLTAQREVLYTRR